MRKLLYWFVWNGWSNVHGRTARCCDSCYHVDKLRCISCDYCNLHNVQVKPILICDEFKWKPEEKSIWDKD